MLDESSYLPFVAGKLPQGPWLIVSPHPDDETFGMGGALLLAAEQGIATDVLFLTSGELGGAEGIAAIRETEALEVARLLGVGNVSFWRLPDRSLLAYASVIDRLAEAIALTKPGCLFFPSPAEPHPDHRAASVIAWEALRKTEFTAEPWSYEISVQGPVNKLLDISSVAQRKREMMHVYASQMTENNYVERIMGLNQARAWSLPMDVSHAEAFYAWPKMNKPLNAILLEMHGHTLGTDALPDAMPKVSVIMRTKNRPKSLREALVSVASQTHRDIELVVVNDGGEDVEAIVSAYATGSIKHLVYHAWSSGMGRPAAANAGLEQAQGDWVMFLDDDDSISPSHIATLLAKAQQRPFPRIVYSGVRGLDAQGREIHLWNLPYTATRLLRGNFLPIHAVLFQRSLLGSDVRFDPNFEIYEDWDFWSQLARKTAFVGTNEITATYHLCGDSGTWDDQHRQANGRLQYYAKWLPLLAPDELNDALMDANDQEVKARRLEGNINQLEAKINQQEGNINQLEAKINQQEGNINQLEAKINQQEADYSALAQCHQASENAKDAKIKRLEADCAELAERNLALDLHNQDLSATRQALLASTSWRLTHPLRRLIQALRIHR